MKTMSPAAGTSSSAAGISAAGANNATQHHVLPAAGIAGSSGSQQQQVQLVSRKLPCGRSRKPEPAAEVGMHECNSMHQVISSRSCQNLIARTACWLSLLSHNRLCSLVAGKLLVSCWCACVAAVRGKHACCKYVSYDVYRVHHMYNIDTCMHSSVMIKMFFRYYAIVTNVMMVFDVLLHPCMHCPACCYVRNYLKCAIVHAATTTASTNCWTAGHPAPQARPASQEELQAGGQSGQ